MPGAAAFLLDLSPGLDAATGPEPGTSRVLVPCYLFIETAAPVRTKGFGQYSSASAQMDITLLALSPERPHHSACTLTRKAPPLYLHSHPKGPTTLLALSPKRPHHSARTLTRKAPPLCSHSYPRGPTTLLALILGRWQARGGSARPMFLWLSLRTHSSS